MVISSHMSTPKLDLQKTLAGVNLKLAPRAGSVYP